MTTTIIQYSEEQRQSFIERLKDMIERGGKRWHCALTNDARLKVRKYDELRQFIDSETPLLQNGKYTINTKVYWILNGLKDFPRCKECGKRIKKNIRVQYDGHKGYADFCSCKCSLENEDTQQHYREACIRKYGVDNCSKSDIVKEKIKSTHFKKYGCWNTQTSDFLSNCSNIRSVGECQVYKFVQGVVKNHPIFQSDRTQMIPNERNGWKCNHELDIWIPDLKHAIEFQGDYWHDPIRFPRTGYNDQEKLIQCQEKGVELIQVNECDWKHHREDVELKLRKIIDEKQARK